MHYQGDICASGSVSVYYIFRILHTYHMFFSLMTASLKLTALALLRIIPSRILSTPPPKSPGVYLTFPPEIVTTCTCLHIRRHFRRQSSVVIFIPSEVMIFAPTRVSVSPKFSNKKWIRKTVFSGEFSFFGRGKTNFFGGGYNFKTG